MKERPIIFNDVMVRAILEGRKTQARRVVRPDGADHILPFNGADNLPTGEFGWCPSPALITKHIRCPFGQTGERLWVRECWRQAYPKTSYSDGFVYRADAAKALGMDEYSSRYKWRPSIHMPRKASRITLEITGVRVERLQDISRSDCMAEGLRTIEYKGESYGFDGGNKTGYGSPTGAFSALWQSIYGAESWQSNPWVWVVEFKRIDSNSKPI